jgi:hypothetical protein
MNPDVSAALRTVSPRVRLPLALFKLMASATMLPGVGRSGQFGNCAEAAKQPDTIICPANPNFQNFFIACTPCLAL